MLKAVTSFGVRCSLSLNHIDTDMQKRASAAADICAKTRASLVDVICGVATGAVDRIRPAFPFDKPISRCWAQSRTLANAARGTARTAMCAAADKGSRTAHSFLKASMLFLKRLLLGDTRFAAICTLARG
jgi:hypothetical protein